MRQASQKIQKRGTLWIWDDQKGFPKKAASDMGYLGLNYGHDWGCSWDKVSKNSDSCKENLRLQRHMRAYVVTPSWQPYTPLQFYFNICQPPNLCVLLLLDPPALQNQRPHGLRWQARLWVRAGEPRPHHTLILVTPELRGSQSRLAGRTSLDSNFTPSQTSWREYGTRYRNGMKRRSAAEWKPPWWQQSYRFKPISSECGGVCKSVGWRLSSCLI